MRKTFIITFLISLLTSNLYAERQVLFSGDSGLPSTTVTNYNFLSGSGLTWHATEANRQNYLSENVSISNLRVQLSASPGTDKSYTFTVRADSADTSPVISCTVSGANTSCTDTTNIAQIIATDKLSLKCAPSGTPATVRVRWSIVINGQSKRTSRLLGASSPATWLVPAPTTMFIPLHGGNITQVTTEQRTRTLMPFAGTARNLYVSGGIGSASDPPSDLTYTVLKNGNATSVTCTVYSTDPDGDCSDTTNSFTFSAGDSLNLQLVSSEPNSIPNTNINAALTIEANTEGDFLSAESSNNLLSTTATRYLSFSSGNSAVNATESNVYTLGQTGTITKAGIVTTMYAELDGTAGGAMSDDYTITLMQNGNASDISCAITNGNTTCNDTGTVTLANDDVLDTKIVPTGTVTARRLNTGFLVNLKQRRVGNAE